MSRRLTWISLLIAVTVLVGIYFFHQTGAGRVWANIGFIHLSKALLSSENSSMSQSMLAVSGLNRAASYIPLDDDIQWGIGYALMVQGDSQAAIKIWKKIGAEDTLFYLGSQALQEKKYSLALMWFERAAAVLENDGKTWYYIGMTYAAMNSWQDAIKAYDQAVVYLGNQRDDVAVSDVYCEKGWLFHWALQPRKPGEARTNYQLAFDAGEFGSTEHQTLCLFRYAELLMWQFNEPADAAKYYAAALELEPGQTRYLATLVYADYRDSGDHLAAEQRLLAVIKDNPDDLWGYWRLGDMYRDENMVAEAVAMYQKALQIDPNNEQLKSRLGEVQEK